MFRGAVNVSGAPGESRARLNHLLIPAVQTCSRALVMQRPTISTADALATASFHSEKKRLLRK